MFIALGQRMFARSGGATYFAALGQRRKQPFKLEHVAPLERKHRRWPLTINIPLLRSATAIKFQNCFEGK